MVAGADHVLAEGVDVLTYQRTCPFARGTCDEDGVDVACVGAEHERADGVVSSSKPLVLADGTVVRDLVVRFEGGRAVQIDSATAHDTMRTITAHDDGAARLGEVALVDDEGRIGKLDTVFYDTLIDENAASHLAFGNAYQATVSPEDFDRINVSSIHIDFMIGGDGVSVSGVTRDGTRVPVLRGGVWQL